MGEVVEQSAVLENEPIENRTVVWTQPRERH